ncbi:MAG TPA: hypothetical protein ENI19_03295 [Candidatus Nealsonbacteria bacterium]|uniref:STAS/SEC14 domain-containing protein n=1 Tax=marine sediment metagenome TaxID=412755 RepID=A0A0F9VC08_9ZZZZ|nr:hypothetical protein [Candidatus Nealsonbacteria bacterium]HEB46705.1 hypothetical protein [Candidatus Nealsonbacteria bacterium]
MKSDEELKKAYRFYIGKDGIINLEFLVLLDDPKDRERIAELVDARGDAILAKDPGRQYNFLIDLSRIKKFKPMSPREQERYIKMIAKQQVNKIACIGLNPFYRTVAYLIVKLSGKLPRTGFFNSKKKAVVWLKEK